jgi:hypothetical protein
LVSHNHAEEELVSVLKVDKRKEDEGNPATSGKRGYAAIAMRPFLVSAKKDEEY